MPDASPKPRNPINTALEEAARTQASALADALAPATSLSTPLIEMLAPGLLGLMRAAREDDPESESSFGTASREDATQKTRGKKPLLTLNNFEWATLLLDVINEHEPKWSTFSDARRDLRLQKAIENAEKPAGPDAAVKGAQRVLQGLGEDTGGQGNRFAEMLKKHESTIRVRHAHLSGPDSSG